MLIDSEQYVYKKEVDWSLLMEGLTIPVENQVVFSTIAGRFLKKGESKDIRVYLNGVSYSAKIKNVNFDKKFKRKSDVVQIRYTRNGELSKAIQNAFPKSYSYLFNMRQAREMGDRSIIRMPASDKEYIAIYTTEYDDSYIFETISKSDLDTLGKIVEGKSERILEAEFNFDSTDNTAGLKEVPQIVRLRKLNKKIGDNLKILYNYRCQLCGQLIGEEFSSHVAEAHHIDYFVNSLNNDASNQIIVCPNHHSIIHDVDPKFDRNRLCYIYNNGYEQSVTINKHL